MRVCFWTLAEITGGHPTSHSFREGGQFLAATRSLVSTRPCRQIYWAAVLEEEAADMACCWIRPTPNPPMTPASSPTSISTGILSRIHSILPAMF
jgi:hypothetical protein